MIRFRNWLPLVLALGAVTLAGCATPQPSGKQEWDGLVRQSGGPLRAVFVKPDAEIVAYRNVMLDPVQISFARNWEPNRGGRSQLNRLDANDIASIQTRLAELFRETFRAELERGGYQLVDTAGPDTLRVTPAIVDLYITAPDNQPPGRSRVYTANAGRMTLVAELRDSTTGEILARAVDTRTARNSGTWQVTTSVTNTQDARRAITVWARALREALDEMYGRAQAK